MTPCPNCEWYIDIICKDCRRPMGEHDLARLSCPPKPEEPKAEKCCEYEEAKAGTKRQAGSVYELCDKHFKDITKPSPPEKAKQPSAHTNQCSDGCCTGKQLNPNGNAPPKKDAVEEKIQEIMEASVYGHKLKDIDLAVRWGHGFEDQLRALVRLARQSKGDK